ncbi:MAG: glycoside hydrolase family 3 C-terminal domain-containing protein, partial [Bifidobacteriaceae bacterium]|nr:glycoside hydrolase family 3 C-terminal domain-containing protein [Bifidobacteriaceae bacterium]
MSMSASRPHHSSPKGVKRFVAVITAGALGASGLIAGIGIAGPAAAADYPYQDQDLPFEVRAADLVSRMTLQEKYTQFRAQTQNNGSDAPAIARLGVARYGYWNEALHGVARSGRATEFPTGLGIATTWNRDLVKQMATATSDEARAYNNRTVGGSGDTLWGNQSAYRKGLTYWSPTINMHRDPRWGRAEETYGEDPYLTGEIGEQFTVGMQGEDEKYLKTIVTPKHYLANNTETGRHTTSANFADKELREYYTPAFAHLVSPEVGAQSIMTAYNRVNEEPVSASQYLIEDLVRRTWGFTGFVVSDCDAIRNVWSRHYWDPEGDGTPITSAEAVAYTLKAGTDLDCMDNDYPTYFPASLNQAQMSEADMDVALTRIFTSRFQFGEFDDPDKVPWTSEQYAWANQIDAPAHHATAQQMSEEAVVLLKNTPAPGETKPILPIDPDINDIVVLGYLGGTATHGDYSPSTRLDTRTPIEGIRDVAQSINPAATVTAINPYSTTQTTGQKPTITDIRFGDGTADVATISNTTVKEWAGWGAMAPWGNTQPLRGSDRVWGAWFRLDADIPATATTVGLTQGNVNNTAPGYQVEVRLGSYSGPVVASGIPATGPSGSATRVPYTGPTGPQTLYFVMTNTTRQYDDAVSDPGNALDANGFEPAEEAAIAAADLVIAFVGTTDGNANAANSDSAEDHDRAELRLPRSQDTMIAEAAELNPNIVTYIQAISQIDVTPIQDHSAALLWSTYNGEHQGVAAGNLLYGVANPSGKLVFTNYANAEAQLATAYDYQMSAADGKNGRTYQYFGGDVDYPFGYGLSYSTFEYSNIRLDKRSVDVDGSFTARVDVRNTSSVDGKEVVQLYASAPGADGVTRPVRQLKGFEKVSIPAGAVKTVAIRVDAKDLWFWDDSDPDTRKQHKIYDLGEWTVFVGGSSAEGLSEGIELTGELDPRLNVVTAVPDGVVLDTQIPEFKIHANLTATRNDDSFYDLDQIEVVYASSDPAVATVDADGTVSGVGPGWSLIEATVTADGVTKTESFPVIVQGPDLSRAAVKFGDKTVTVSEAAAGVQLDASPLNTTVTTVVYGKSTYDINTAGASVTSNGVFTATQPGTARITAVVTNAPQTTVRLTRTATITVVPDPLPGDGLPYMDTSVSFDERAADLVSRMTLAEKALQFRATLQNSGTVAPAIPRLGVTRYNYWNEALHGVARAGTTAPHNLGGVAANNPGTATEFPTG